MFRVCAYEKELIDALKAGHWPEGCAPELRAHVASCASCSDLVLLTEAFQRAKSASVQESPVGTPGLLWWRAQLRRRNAAAERVGQPVAIAQTFAFLLTLLVAAVFVASQYKYGLHWASWGLTPSRILHLVSIGTADWNLALLIPGAGILILLSCVVLYLASEKQ
jgi:hypothetical protein